MNKVIQRYLTKIAVQGRIDLLNSYYVEHGDIFVYCVIVRIDNKQRIETMQHYKRDYIILLKNFIKKGKQILEEE